MIPRLSRRIQLILLFVWVPLTFLISQEARIKVRVEQVSLYVRIFDKDGRFVSNLGPQDFTVKEDGTIQKILTCIEVNRSSAGSKINQPSPAAQVIHASANRESDPNRREMVVFHFDPMTLTPDALKRAKAAVREILEQAPAGDTYWGLGGAGFFSGFTTDTKTVLDRLARLDYSELNRRATPLAEEGDLQHIDAPFRGLQGEGAVVSPIPSGQSNVGAVGSYLFRAYSLLLKYVPGRKTLVLFSAGYGNPQLYLTPAEEFHDTSLDLFDAAYQARLLNDANITLVAVNPFGVSAISPPSVLFDPKALATLPKTREGRLQLERRLDTGTYELAAASHFLRTAARDTGGEAVIGNNDIKRNLANALERTSSYYLISYASSNDSLDGKFRKIKVECRMSGVQVKHRDGYFASLPIPRASTVQRILISRLVNPEAPSDYSVSLQAGPTVKVDGESFLPFKLALPMSQLVFRELADENGKAKKYSCRLIVGAYLQDAPSPPLYKSISFFLSEKQFQDLQNQNFIYSDRMKVQQFGIARLVVAVLSSDLIHMGSTATQVEVTKP